MDIGIIITVIPPILTAILAYAVARKRNLLADDLNKAKINADIQVQALNIVRGVMNDMRDEFRREIDNLKKEKDELKTQVNNNEVQIKSLSSQLKASDELIDMLKTEIATLQTTIKVYEEEIVRLRKG